MSIKDKREIARRKAQSIKDKKAAIAPTSPQKGKAKRSREVSLQRPIVGPPRSSNQTSGVKSERRLATVGSMKMSIGDTSIRIKGREMFRFYNQAAVNSYAVIDNVLISPIALASSRLAAMAGLYEKFVFNSLVLRWIPTGPTTVTGGLIMSWDSDPTDATPPATIAGTRSFTEHPCSITFPPWETAQIKIGPPNGFIGYTDGYSGAEERIVFQGQWYLAATAGISSLTGYVEMDYDITFMDPQVSGVTTGSIAATFSTPTSTAYVPTTDLIPLATLAYAVSNPAVRTGTVVLPSGLVRTGVIVPPNSQYEITFTVNASVTPGSPSTIAATVWSSTAVNLSLSLPPSQYYQTTFPLNVANDTTYLKMIVNNLSLAPYYVVPNVSVNTTGIFTWLAKQVPTGSALV